MILDLYPCYSITIELTCIVDSRAPIVNPKHESACPEEEVECPSLQALRSWAEKDVAEMGFEPIRPCGQGILSPAGRPHYPPKDAIPAHQTVRPRSSVYGFGRGKNFCHGHFGLARIWVRRYILVYGRQGCHDILVNSADGSASLPGLCLGADQGPASKGNPTVTRGHLQDTDRRTLPLTTDLMRLLIELQMAQLEGSPYTFVPTDRYELIQELRRTGQWSVEKGRSVLSVSPKGRHRSCSDRLRGITQGPFCCAPHGNRTRLKNHRT